MTKQYDNYADLITFSRASSGTALRPVSYGAELVTNGTFDSAANWTLTGSAAISGGQVTLSAQFDSVEQNINITNGKIVRISYQVVSNTDQVNVNLALSSQGFTNSTIIINNDVGTHTIDVVVVDATKPLRFVLAYATTIVLDNISVKEVIFDQAGDPLTLFNHPTNVPRIEYDASGNRKGLLIEEARTNFVPNSQGGTNVSSFSLGTGSFDLELENYSVAPDGTTTGLQLKWFMGTTGGSYAGVGVSAGTLSSQIRTFSFFGKSNTASNQTVQFRKSDGSVVTSITITPDWQRFSISDSVASTTTGFQIWSPFGASYTANVDISIWGMQLEAGSFPTSYIPTSGSTATRSADVASIPTSAFGYNQKAGTVVVEHQSVASINQRSASINDGTSNNAIQIVVSTSGGGSLVGEIRTNATGQLFQPSPIGITAGQNYKIAMAYAENDAAVSRDGTLGTDSSVVVPAVSNLVIGAGTSTFAFLNGHIKSIQYYPRRLSNAQLQELTA